MEFLSLGFVESYCYPILCVRRRSKSETPTNAIMVLLTEGVKVFLKGSWDVPPEMKVDFSTREKM